MILIALEAAVTAFVAAYLVWWQVGVHHRRAIAWELLVLQLKPKWSIVELGQRPSRSEDLFIPPEDNWPSIGGAQGLWVMYENAGVMLTMANYAAHRGSAVDREVLASLQYNALQIRMCVLVALSKLACSRVNESTAATIARATEFYADMVQQMAKLTQINERAFTPGFAPLA